ncbi:hypothetical protein E2562_002285 [Oryza meyeriana var. granulata]|uniref:Glycerol-3-phosphate acyltransferase RAM2/GPAT1-8 HAD-like domain-containing protein n=1 Tax=Oryza meyeriana var. granulata TaxID=110450 RepID=A0A6G1BJH1_9ORYZ|nr:hypothetical protein E2562_002285 [Oryza meyeriana var. granulata]
MANLTKLFPAVFSLLLHGGGEPPASTLPPPHVPAVTVHRCLPPAVRLSGAGGERTALVVDVEGALLRSSRSLFPYFMLVAVEAGSFLRGLMLLLLYPVISLLAGDVAVRAMAAVAFCGLRESQFRAGRAVLPRWLLEDVGKEALDAVTRRSSPATGRRTTTTVVWASSMPRVMVEPFLKEYLTPPDEAAGGGVVVAAREMKVVWGFYTGLLEDGGEVASSPEVRRAMAGVDDVVGLSGGSMDLLRSPLVSFCKEVYVVSGEEKSKWRPLQRREYPRPLVFHDGRLAFLPTPLAAAAMLVWLPFGAALAAARIAVALALPYRYATLLLAATGQCV